jgi:23S rRNA (uridine2552-2'-O)-methyltransferase
MSKRWFAEKKREHYYRLAKRENYRSRAAYKLKQIQYRFNAIHPGWQVVDLGASPGGWSQVAAEIVNQRGGKGIVVAVDIARMKPIEGVTILRGDMRKDEIAAAVHKALGNEKADVVISDMSPDISGTYSVDHARSIELSEAALDFARGTLRPGGNFVVKVFQGELFEVFLSQVRRSFKNVRSHRPPASRSQSSETYVVAKGFNPKRWAQGAGGRVQGASAAGERILPDRQGSGQTITVLPGRVHGRTKKGLDEEE